MLKVHAPGVAALVLMAAPALAADYRVAQVAGRLYSPTVLTIGVGDTVTWRNDDTMPHTTTSGTAGNPDGKFDSANMNPGQTFSYTFASAGTYDYHCTYHSGMNGQVVVLANSWLVRAEAGRKFSPANIDIRVGDAIIWRNDDTMDHTATSGTFGNPDGLFDSANLAPLATFAHTFTAPGSFDYYCDYHSGMVGKVTVWPAGTAIVEMRAGRLFEPPSLSIRPGDAVIWRNVDTMDHTTTSGQNQTPDGLWDSGNMPADATFARSFPVAGTFDYYCEYHPGMTGQVLVAATPSSVLLHATRSGPDVRLDWSGGTAPWDLLRGSARDLGDLLSYKQVSSGNTDHDPGAVAGPPALLFYQVR